MSALALGAITGGQSREYQYILYIILDKMNNVVKTQRNSTQLNSKATSFGVRHSSHVYPTPPT